MIQTQTTSGPRSYLEKCAAFLSRIARWAGRSLASHTRTLPWVVLLACSCSHETVSPARQAREGANSTRGAYTGKTGNNRLYYCHSDLLLRIFILASMEKYAVSAVMPCSWRASAMGAASAGFTGSRQLPIVAKTSLMQQIPGLPRSQG